MLANLCLLILTYLNLIISKLQRQNREEDDGEDERFGGVVALYGGG